ncbi:hypothetical protein CAUPRSCDRAFT_11248 [Caulochytrium protostelioides]|uniref:Uncharacterized protein n=1 Tax=Caulochytrium protostelioides TaxID=1555241 RepID=A0A4P9WWI7_9FUNG|nr:hypothetical protein CAUPRSCDRAFT_11248 [Caulochytrium protostelioides]
MMLGIKSTLLAFAGGALMLGTRGAHADFPEPSQHLFAADGVYVARLRGSAVYFGQNAPLGGHVGVRHDAGRLGSPGQLGLLYDIVHAGLSAELAVSASGVGCLLQPVFAHQHGRADYQ